jgi:hypothetical protein
MIDKEKYKGHTPGPWKNFKVIDKETNDKFIQRGFHADLDLMIDAPLLLEEVKRLRKGIIDFANKWKHNYSTKELLEMIE